MPAGPQKKQRRAKKPLLLISLAVGLMVILSFGVILVGSFVKILGVEAGISKLHQIGIEIEEASADEGADFLTTAGFDLASVFIYLTAQLGELGLASATTVKMIIIIVISMGILRLIVKKTGIAVRRPV